MDAEFEAVAVYNMVSHIETGYLYDAEGNRVAKGTITSWSCDTTQNGFTLTNSYILSPGGQQLTEMAWSGGTAQWSHTNVWAAGAGLIATYSADPDPSQGVAALLDFQFGYWLGTRRVLTDYTDLIEATCDSLPYGNGETCAPTPTEHLYTQHERDAETNNDYFGARYYSSLSGRFLTPDRSAKVEPVPYAKMDNPQSLNLYAYVGNNPLSGVDADGHSGGILSGLWAAITGNEGGTNQNGTEEFAAVNLGGMAQQQNLSNAQNAAMNNPKFAPGYGGHTHCNQGACSIGRAMHVPMGPLTDAHGNPLLANQIRANLAKPGSGYHAVSAAEAAQLAGKGIVVFVTGPGHIATVAADQNQNLRGRGPIIANVGYKNGDMRLNYVFPKSELPEVRFYTPNQ